MAKKAAAKKAAPLRRSMSDAHKAALAEGREQGRAVRRYLEALEQHKPKRGRKRTPESVERRLQDIESGLVDASPLDRVHLMQERLDLQAEVAAMNGDAGDLQALEEEFVQAAAAYGSRRGLSYIAWRKAGVPPAVLRRAGITRAT